MRSSKPNSWDNAELLAMAVRLRRLRKCPQDVEDEFSYTVMSVVRMASILLARKEKYRTRKEFFLDADRQAELSLLVLEKLDTGADTNDPPRLINYLVKTVQNRLRNMVRDDIRHSNRATFSPLEEEACNYAYDIDGRARRMVNNRKVCNTEFKP